MEYIFHFLALFILIGFLFKVSFYSWKGRIAAALVAAILMRVIAPWIIELPHAQLTSLFTLRPWLLNLSVFITIEASIMIGFCFDSIAVPKQNSWYYRILHTCLRLYPGLLVVGVLAYLLSYLLYTTPGIDFQALPWLASGATLLIVGAGSELVRWILPDRPMRLELLFLVNLFIIILNIVLTGY